jgi:hypothetical protein
MFTNKKVDIKFFSFVVLKQKKTIEKSNTLLFVYSIPSTDISRVTRPSECFGAGQIT